MGGMWQLSWWLCAWLVPLVIGEAAEAPTRPVTLTWADNSDNELGFQIGRALPGGSWIVIGEAAEDAETFVDQTSLAGITYRYRVGAYNTAGVAWSNEATIALPPAESAPDAPDTLNLTFERPGRLINLSNRGLVRVGEQIAIGGFTIADAPVTLLIRAVGPSLAQFGVEDVLADPQLQIVGGPGNDNWSGEDVAQAAAQVFAFSLPVGSKDAALLVTLEPGSYTVHVSGVGGTQGVALLELYLVP